jgi:hypothetical protein
MDAFVIDVSVIAIDDSGGILGQAGTTTGFALTGGSYVYASEGFMEFDSADSANQISNGSLGDLILHEMAYVIGNRTLWSRSAAGTPGDQELYVSGGGQYTGAEGLAAYQNEFVGQSAATFVSVELGGGAGTANGSRDEIDGVEAQRELFV